jgi:hypothetical protein
MAEEQQFSIPGAECLKHACKLALVDDKPIMMDYYADSVEKKVIIGVRENGEKLLVKSADEYTSPISKIYKSGEEYIIVTENSIYLVSAATENKRIS